MTRREETLADLAQRVPRVAGLLPEHLICNADDAEDELQSDAALVDQWGRAHPLLRTSSIGRDVERTTLAILQGSVSRQHASLRLEGAAWLLEDLGSTNGTFLDGKRVHAPVAVPDRAIVSIGDVALLLVADRTSLRSRGPSDSMHATSSRPERGALRIVPSASGAGLIENGATSITLGSTQFALLELLAARRREERDRPPEVRGFVRTVELLSSLPWDTSHPEDNHVKQVVRRVRRALERAGFEDAIESRHGLGYRLLVDPG